MSMDQILSKAIEIGELMRDTDQVKRLMAANMAFEADSELRDKVGSFESLRQSLMQMEQSGAKPEDMEAKNGELMNVYETIMANPVMQEMTDANNEVQEVMNHILRTISSCIVNASDDCGSCGGDCGGCSGCH